MIQFIVIQKKLKCFPESWYLLPELKCIQLSSCQSKRQKQKTFLILKNDLFKILQRCLLSTDVQYFRQNTRVILIVLSHSNKQTVAIHSLARKFFHLNLKGNIILAGAKSPTQQEHSACTCISYFENSVSFCPVKNDLDGGHIKPAQLLQQKN